MLYGCGRPRERILVVAGAPAPIHTHVYRCILSLFFDVGYLLDVNVTHLLRFHVDDVEKNRSMMAEGRRSKS